MIKLTKTFLVAFKLLIAFFFDFITDIILFICTYCNETTEESSAN